MEEKNPIEEILSNSCYCEILPHLQIYQEAQETEQILYLMEPHHFRGFVENAIRSCTSVVFEIFEYFYNESIPSTFPNPSMELTQLKPNTNYLNEIYNNLLEGSSHFLSALQNFEILLSNYKRKLQNAGERAENQGAGWGTFGAIVGGVLLGPLGAVAGAYGGGYFGGSVIENELEQDAKILNSTFASILGEYDNFVKKILITSFNFIQNYKNYLDTKISEESAKYLPLNNNINALEEVSSNHSETNDWKICPMCAEQVRFAAKICRFCRHEFF